MRKIWATLTAACFVVGLGACMGRTPQPVAVVQPQDQMMDCTAIYAEVAYNNKKVEQLGATRAGKSRRT